MRNAGEIAKKVCEFAGSLVKPGVTLDYIDRTVRFVDRFESRLMSMP